MKQVRTLIGACLLAVLVMSSIAVATAAAEQPEFGHCKVVPKKTGKYNSKCTKTETGNSAKGEWEGGPGPQPGFIWKAEFSGFPPKYNDCTSAITAEEQAINRAHRAESASEPEKAELEQEAREFAQHAENEYLLAASPETTPWTRAHCEAYDEEQSPRAPVELVTKLPEAKHAKAALHVTCGNVNAEGEISGLSTESLAITFSQCASNLGQCSSAGAGEGEIRSSALVAELGIFDKKINPPLEKTGISLEAEGHGPFAEFTCGTTTVVVTGSVITEVKANKSVASEIISFGEKKGQQNIKSFVGQTNDVLEVSLDGGAPIESGLALKVEQNDKEADQIKSSV